MPFARPTLAELIERVRSDMRGRLEIEGPLLRRAMVDVLSTVWAGVGHTMHGFLDWAVKQLFGDTAEREQLLRRAKLYGITPVPATFATGNVVASGGSGNLIPTDTILRLGEASYRVTAGQVINVSEHATLPVIALVAGDEANVPAGTTLAFESPIPGVDPTVVVDVDGITGGNDEEDTESLRARYLQRLREPPEGGADQDYVAWAREVAGVTRAWVYEHELGLGTVVVRFVRDLDPDIFPDAGEVAAVQAKYSGERPITAAVTAMAPVELPVDFTIHVEPNNADTRAAVEAELTDLLRRVAEPGNGAGRGTVKLSAIQTAIGISAGVTDYTLTVPLANVVPGVGELPVLGDVTWV